MTLKLSSIVLTIRSQEDRDFIVDDLDTPLDPEEEERIAFHRERLALINKQEMADLEMRAKVRTQIRREAEKKKAEELEASRRRAVGLGRSGNEGIMYTSVPVQ